MRKSKSEVKHLSATLTPTKVDPDPSGVMEGKIENKTKTDIPWKTVKRRTNLNKETENIKRKCSSPTPGQMASNKKTLNTSTSPKVNLYPEIHRGPAYIELKLAPEKIKKSKAFNLMYMAKGMSNIAAGAHSIKARDFNKAEVQFNNYKEANKALTSKTLADQGILTHIPRYRIEKKRILKGYSNEFDTNDIINNASSPCRILYAKRLNRRTVDEITNEIK